MQLPNMKKTTKKHSTYTFLKYVHLIPVLWQYQYTLQMNQVYFPWKKTKTVGWFYIHDKTLLSCGK